jgi:hypothetical protein
MLIIYSPRAVQVQALVIYRYLITILFSIIMKYIILEYILHLKFQKINYSKCLHHFYPYIFFARKTHSFIATNDIEHVSQENCCYPYYYVAEVFWITLYAIFPIRLFSFTSIIIFFWNLFV